MNKKRWKKISGERLKNWRRTLYISFNSFSIAQKTIYRGHKREMFGKFNLILNTSNDKFIYDDSKASWMDWRLKETSESKFSSFVIFFQPFPPQKLHMWISLLMYSWRLTLCFSVSYEQHKSRVMEAIYICRQRKAAAVLAVQLKEHWASFFFVSRVAFRCKKKMNRNVARWVFLSLYKSWSNCSRFS